MKGKSKIPQYGFLIATLCWAAYHFLDSLGPTIFSVVLCLWLIVWVIEKEKKDEG